MENHIGIPALIKEAVLFQMNIIWNKVNYFIKYKESFNVSQRSQKAYQVSNAGTSPIGSSS